MSLNQSFEVARTVIEEATEQFSPCWKLNKEKMRNFILFCTLIDSFIEELNAETMTASVDEIMMTVSIAVYSKEAKYLNDCYYMKLAKRPAQIEVTSDGRELEVVFNFPSLWEKAAKSFFGKEVQ